MSKVNGVFREARRVFDSTGLDSLILFVTNACNLRCWFCCYADNLNQTKDIPFESLLKLSATMPRFRALLLSGGEPFIRPRLDEIMLAFVRNNGIRSIYIPTNGWYLERTEAMCRSFLEQEHEVMLNLSFSVDGLQETHDQIRTKGKKGSFANLCKTIEHLAPWRERYPNLRLRVNSVVTPDNIGEMRATIDYFHTHHDVDEHALEIVRDLTWLDAHHDSPERKGIAQEYHELIEYSYRLYFMNGARGGRAQFRDLPETLSNLATYAYSLATSEIKVERMMGKLWPFACTAGRKILVVSGSGSLRACEHRGEVVDLREFDFDFGRAMATGRMENEMQQIRKDRCDCLHGCFVGNSLQHTPRAIVTRALPKVLHTLRKPSSKTSAIPAPQE